MEKKTGIKQENDNGAITYKDLYLGAIGIAYFRSIEIKEAPGEHASLFVEAVLNSDTSENAFHEIEDTISLVYKKDNEDKVLFYGVLKDIAMEMSWSYG